MSEEHKMRQVYVEKITLNIGTGAPGEELDKSVALLNKISGMKAVRTKTTKRIPTWGVRPGLEIGCMVTVRGKKAHDLVPQLLKAVNSTLKPSSFDERGNVSFGIKEYLDIPKVEYDSKIGIRGLEVAVTLSRPGYRVKRRVVHRSRVGRRHQVTKDEAIAYMRNEFHAAVEE